MNLGLFHLFRLKQIPIAQNQQLNNSYETDRNYYYNGQYQNVYNALAQNVVDMKGGNRAYFRGNDQGRSMVFRVYKLIIESEYEMNQIDRAEWFKDYLINYFMGIFSPEQVYDCLEYAQL